MGYYSDPTANAALGSINKEFKRMEKKAKTLIKLWQEGKISDEAIDMAQLGFGGIYKNVLKKVLAEEIEKEAAENEKKESAKQEGT